LNTAPPWNGNDFVARRKGRAWQTLLLIAEHKCKWLIIALQFGKRAVTAVPQQQLGTAS
jgi:hypothetical protein